MSGVPITSASTGSGQTGVNLGAHLDGEGGVTVGQVTVGHTLLIVILALVGLWFLGGVVFRKARL